jgi:hypothetical protein
MSRLGQRDMLVLRGVYAWLGTRGGPEYVITRGAIEAIGAERGVPDAAERLMRLLDLGYLASAPRPDYPGWYQEDGSGFVLTVVQGFARKGRQALGLP